MPERERAEPGGAGQRDVRAVRRERRLHHAQTGQVINSTRTVLGPDYGTVTEQATIGYSRYNARRAEPALREGPGEHPRRLHATASRWTSSSNLGEQVNPFDVALSEAPSAFDMRHNFVVSYNYELPFERLLQHDATSWTTGWSLSGTTRFSSGFPVTLYNPTDTSLLGTFGNGVNNNLLDTPNYTPGCDLQINHDPAKGPAFNTACFSLPPLGQLGNAPRRFFYGPGIENFDLALIKHVTFDQSRRLEMRLETFNVLQSSAVLRRRRGRRQYRQPDLRQDRRPRPRRASSSSPRSSRSELIPTPLEPGASTASGRFRKRLSVLQPVFRCRMRANVESRRPRRASDLRHRHSAGVQRAAHRHSL